MKTIWTIGHSTRKFEEFLELLQSQNIQTLVDVRHYPGSRKFPQYNKENLREALQKENIGYIHLVDLGGRRKPEPNSKNDAWRNASFQGYADYMETEPFHNALQTLKEIASTQKTVIMCSEAVWWRCHRSMIADALKTEGWTVLHIISENNVPRHPFTSPAKVINGKLDYSQQT